MVEIVIESVEKSMNDVIQDPLCHLRDKIIATNGRLARVREIWSSKADYELGKQAKAIEELGFLLNEIKGFQPNQARKIEPKEIIQFDSEEIHTALTGLIRVKGKAPKIEDALLCHQCLKFDVKTGHKEEITFE